MSVIIRLMTSHLFLCCLHIPCYLTSYKQNMTWQIPKSDVRTCLILFSQLGPNPSFLDSEQLVRGQSGKLSHGGTLYLVNQNHPFKLQYSLSSNGAASGTVRAGLKATDKTKGGPNGKEKEAQSSPNPKRSIKDFFPTSPMKVICLFIVLKLGRFIPYVIFTCSCNVTTEMMLIKGS